MVLRRLEKWNWLGDISILSLAGNNWHEWQNNYTTLVAAILNSWIKRPCLRQYGYAACDLALEI